MRPTVDHNSSFVTRLKTPMSPHSIQYVVEKYVDEAGIKQVSTTRYATPWFPSISRIGKM